MAYILQNVEAKYANSNMHGKMSTNIHHKSILL